MEHHIDNKMKLVPLVAAVLGTTGATVAHAAEPSYEELRQQVQQLQARLNDIEARQQQVHSVEMDRTVADVLKDAERRSHLLSVDSALTAGYDKGFFIGSADGNFLLRPGVGLQFRYVANLTTGDDDEVEDGFEVRRLRPRIDGHVFSPRLTYGFQWDTARSGGDVTLLDAWAQYQIADDWAVRLGQFKESVFHEKDVSFTRQLAVDRSLLDAVLGGNQTDRVQGVALIYGGGKDDDFRAELTFHDGANSKNTDFRDSGSGFGVGGRVEHKAFGNWGDYRDFTAKGTKDNLLVLGAGADLTQSGDTDNLRSVVDVQWENASGLGAFGAVYGNFVDGGDDGNRSDYGALVQAGYLLTPSWEIFGRYGVILFDDDAVDVEDTAHEIVGGVNYYLGPDGSYKHSAKITVDAVYLPNGFPSNQTGLGILASDDAEFVLRAQFTLAL